RWWRCGSKRPGASDRGGWESRCERAGLETPPPADKLPAPPAGRMEEGAQVSALCSLIAVLCPLPYTPSPMRSLRFALLAFAFAAPAPLAHAQLVPSFGVAGGLNFGCLSDAGTAGL